MFGFLEQVIAGLATGSIYAFVALAIVVTYKSTEIINFSQGEMATVSAYFAWMLIERGFSYWQAAGLALAGSFLMGVVLETIFIRPVEGAPKLNCLIITIGLLMIINSTNGFFFTYDNKTFPTAFTSDPIMLGELAISINDLQILLVTLVAMIGMYLFFYYTKLGLIMRAVAENPASSRLLGLRVSNILGVGWGLSAVVGGVAGIQVAPTLFLNPNMMRGAMIYGLSAAILGGLESAGGAVFAGLLMGVLENLLGIYVPFIGQGLKMTFALFVIVIVLILRPDGIFGKPEIERV